MCDVPLVPSSRVIYSAALAWRSAVVVSVVGCRPRLGPMMLSGKKSDVCDDAAMCLTSVETPRKFLHYFVVTSLLLCMHLVHLTVSPFSLWNILPVRLDVFPIFFLQKVFINMRLGIVPQP